MLEEPPGPGRPRCGPATPTAMGSSFATASRSAPTSATVRASLRFRPLPAWSLVHSRQWKMQIPYLARHFTVVCFDGAGSGGSSLPADASAYSDVAFASDALAVMDAAGIDSTVAHCHAVPWAPHGRDP